MGLTKNQLEGLNNNSFPNNNSGYITPDILRQYNDAVIQNTVNQDEYTADSASFSARIDILDPSATSASFAILFDFSASQHTFDQSATASIQSLQQFSSSYNVDSASFDLRIDSLVTKTENSLVTASFNNGTRNLTFTKGDSTQFSVNIPDVSGSTFDTGSLVTTSSFNAYTQSTNDFTASISTSVGLLQTFSGSEYKGDSASFDSRINAAGGAPQIQDEGTILGNATSFNFIGAGVTTTVTSGTASVTIPGGGGSIYTGSFATTGSNTFIGNQIISGNVELPDNYNFTIRNGGVTNLQNTWVKALVTTSSVTIKAGGVIATGSLLTSNDVVAQQRVIATGDISSSANVLGLNISAIENSVAAFNSFTTSVNTYTQSANNQFISLNNITASFNTFTQSYFNDSSSFDNRLDTIEFLDTTFATTGSNTFKGQQTLSDVDLLNQITLGQYSSSLVLFGKGFTSSSMNHITMSGGVTNIIFKDSNATTTTIISGSNNLIANPLAATAGFNRVIGANNILLAGATPQVSGTMAFPVTLNGNYLNGTAGISMRGPVSSSAWTIGQNIITSNLSIGATAGNHAERIVNGLTIAGNYLNSPLTIIANQTALSGSSNIGVTGNIGGGTLILSSSAIAYTNNIGNPTITNSHFSQSLVGVGRMAVLNNIFAGTPSIFISGGLQGAASPAYNNNIMVGSTNLIYCNVAEAPTSGGLYQHSAQSIGIIGNNLTVSASSLAAQTDTLGSQFTGRFNAIDGNKAKTAQTVFAVGTGTSTTNRKTGFLIDSGSNTFVEGTLNVSGSTSMTGSLTISSGSTNNFSIYGHTMFNYGAFQTNVIQSGSAGVSQSVNFEITDSSANVSIANNSQITVENGGVYEIKFSAQLLAATGADDFYLWLKKNGSNVAESATYLPLQNNETNLMSINFIVVANAGDYYELAWQTTNGKGVLQAYNASGNIPSIPSVIMTVTQVR